MSIYSESNTSTTSPTNLYEENLNEETTLDLCSRNLTTMPSVNNDELCAIYLQGNQITTIPDDFFPSLPNLKWLDLRDNELTSLPSTIQEHRSLTHLLLQNNKVTHLPNELGTVPNLKVLQLDGNPIVYPPKDIISAGIVKTLTFLFEKHFDELHKPCPNDVSDDTLSNYTVFNQDSQSYNSVIDGGKLKNNMCIKFTEKDLDGSEEEYYPRIKGKCPKLAKSRYCRFPSFNQSSKYVGPNFAADKVEQTEKIKRSYLKDLALKKHKDLLQAREKILQDRKNTELLRNWRQSYRHAPPAREYNRTFPYDTDPELMTLLSREDIARDLPDKYRRRLVRRCRPTVPRKSTSDVHLAMKIKQLFENLEAIDLNRGTMTPRTEQKLLLGEIHKISEIKQKLMELSTTNSRSVALE